jgi:hypothetical protein
MPVYSFGLPASAALQRQVEPLPSRAVAAYAQERQAALQEAGPSKGDYE